MTKATTKPPHWAMAILGVIAFIFFMLTMFHNAKAQFIKPMQATCTFRSAMINRLTSKDHERVMGAGILKGGDAATELWVNKTSGTFSITTTEGPLMCMVLAGKQWIEYAPKPAWRGEVM